MILGASGKYFYIYLKISNVSPFKEILLTISNKNVKRRVFLFRFFLLTFFKERKMKKFMFVSMMVFVFFMAACASQQKVSQSAAGQQGEDEESWDEETISIPCFVADADTDFFSCTQIVTTTKARRGDAITFARQHAQDDCAQKAKHAVQGLMTSYRNNYGNNKGDDIASKMENGFNHIIDTMLGETKDACLQQSKKADKYGRGTIYLQIKISRDKLADALADAAPDMVSEEEKEKLDFQHHNFKKEMKEALSNYKTEKAGEQAKHAKENTQVFE